MSKNPHDIILRPLITEHASALQGKEAGQYTFQVDPAANKREIRWAVESIFNVKVDKVNTVTRKGKRKRVRYRLGKRADMKRAMVVLQPDQKIELY